MDVDMIALPALYASAAAAQRLVGARIRERRVSLGWSQEMLACRAHLHRTYVSSVESGGRNISLLNLLRIAYELGIDAAVLVEGIELPSSVLRGARREE